MTSTRTATVIVPADLAAALIAAGAATPMGAADDALFPLTADGTPAPARPRYAAPGSALEKTEQVYAALVTAGTTGTPRADIDPITGSPGSSQHALDTLIKAGRAFRVGQSTATRYYATCHRAAWEADLIARTLGTTQEQP